MMQCHLQTHYTSLSLQRMKETIRGTPGQSFPEVCGTMGIARFFLLLSCFLLVFVQGLDIPDPDEIEYIRQQEEATVNGTVHLYCGSDVPTLFIWVFSRPGTERNEPLAYNYGQGSKLLSLASTLGEISLLTNTTTLVIEGVSEEAEGVYTCQALYDMDEPPKVRFYYTQLHLQDEEERSRGSGSPPPDSD
ncbi:V-set and immunoglobulin domain-containing protein 10-like 2 [Danio rerio]|uniref:V-set and immunoglobulin domain-containing protein 10-like 2 n=1 Tax=Danio rerio TaxID=7955 RepID=UPI0035A125AB